MKIRQAGKQTGWREREADKHFLKVGYLSGGLQSKVWGVFGQGHHASLTLTLVFHSLPRLSIVCVCVWCSSVCA